MQRFSCGNCQLWKIPMPFLRLCLCVILLVVLVTACSKNNNSANSLYGNWRMTSSFAGYAGSYHTYRPDSTIILVLGSNMDYQWFNIGSLRYSGKYTIAGGASGS